jgi:hypothetical protein
MFVLTGAGAPEYNTRRCEMTNLTDEPVEHHEHIRVTTTPQTHVVHDHVVTEIEPVPVVQEVAPVYQQEVVHDVGAEERMALNKATQFIWLIGGLVEALIAMRVFLKLIAANPNSAFARLIYGLSDLLVWPFVGLTATPTANGMVLEIPSLIAMIVYAVGFYILVKLIWLFFEQPRARSVKTYERV